MNSSTIKMCAKLCFVGLLTSTLWSCGGASTSDDLLNNEHASTTAQALTKAQDPNANGDGSFCNDPTATCDAGEGDCDSDAQCTGALICGKDIGPKFGMPAKWDVCVPAHCVDGSLSGDETGVDCGGSCGTCTQVGTNGDPNFCTLNSCGAGQGDCDSDAECQAGLICTNNVGADFGFGSNVDVCLPPHCSNSVQDAANGETGVDCGGDCAPCPNMNPLPLGDPNYCNDPNLPCAEGEADCDIDAHCLPGLICKQNVGDQYGFPAFIDVCVSPTCGDGEVTGPNGDLGVDCGGVDCGACNFDIWNKAFRNAGNTRVLAVASDSSGVYAAGNYSGSIDFGGGTLTSLGDSDAFLVKFDANGTFLWQRSLGGTDFDSINNIAISSSGNVSVVGSFESASLAVTPTTLTNATPTKDDAFVASFNGTDGSTLWARSFGDTDNDEAQGVAVDTSGDLYVVGFFKGTVDFGSGAVTAVAGSDAFIAKFAAADGSTVWSRREGGVGDDLAKGIVYSSNGNLTYGVSSRSGTYTVDAMNSITMPLGQTDIIVIQMAADGTFSWGKRLGGSSDDSFEDIATDSSNNIYLTGYFDGTANFGGANIVGQGGFADAFIAKLDSTGAHQASAGYGSDGFDAGESIAVVGSSVYVTGYFQNTVSFGGPNVVSAGGTDVFAVKYTDALAHVQTQRYGKDGLDFGRAFSTDQGVYLGGFYNGSSIDLGSGDISGGSNDNGFLIRLNP